MEKAREESRKNEEEEEEEGEEVEVVSQERLPFKIGDVIVRKEDYDSLLPEQWVTDEIIHFHLEILRRRHPNLGFLGPNQLQILTSPTNLTREDIDPNIAGIRDKKQVFIPLSNATSSTTGSHWALAVYDVKSSTFFYYDSMSSSDSSIYEEKCLKLLNIFNTFVYNGESPGMLALC